LGGDSVVLRRLLQRHRRVRVIEVTRPGTDLPHDLRAAPRGIVFEPDAVVHDGQAGAFAGALLHVEELGEEPAEVDDGEEEEDEDGQHEGELDEGGAALIPPTSMHQCGRPLEHPESLAPDGGLARPLPEVIGPAGGIGDETRWPSYSLW